MNTLRNTVLVIACQVSTQAIAQTFTPLPFQSATGSPSVRAISGDASTVVGQTPLGAGRWTASGGLQVIGVPPGNSVSGPVGVSRDGATVGVIVLNSDETQSTAYRWNELTGFQSTGSLATPNSISGDGSTIVGYNGLGNLTAVRWTAAGGVQGFGPVQGAPLGPLTATVLEATSVNFDGSLVVGTASVRLDNQLPFPRTELLAWRWSPTGGTRLLTNADGSVYLGGSSASDVSSDGNWIVGEGPGLQFFRWREDLGFQFITRITDGIIGDRPRVSDDGATIVYGRNFWTESGGVQTLQQVLTQAGCDFTGWTNLSAVDISGDGRTIAGNGTNPQGQQQGWVATVPGPGGVVMVSSVGLLALATRRRRR